MPVVVIIVLLVLIGLAIKLWFVALPLAVVAAVGFGVWFRRDRQRLQAMDPEARRVELARRADARIERRERYEAERRARSEETTQHRLATGKAKKTPISQVGRQEAQAGLACPRCGGTQFKQRRTRAGRATIVATGLIGAAVTKQKQVQCVTCGARYARG